MTEEKKELNTPNEKKLTPQKSVDGKTEGKSRRRPARKKAPVAAEKKNVDIAATQPVEPKQSAAQKESGSRENRQPKQKSPSQRGRQGGASKQGSSKEKTVSPAAGTLQEKGAAHSVRAPHRNRSASKEPKIRIAF